MCVCLCVPKMQQFILISNMRMLKLKHFVVTRKYFHTIYNSFHPKNLESRIAANEKDFFKNIKIFVPLIHLKLLCGRLEFNSLKLVCNDLGKKKKGKNKR